MLPRLRIILTTWPFVVALTLLVLNDWWFKKNYPSFITGKLSDYSGIFVVALLLISALPKHTYKVFLGVSFLLLWWKSPASQHVIDLFNNITISPIGRVVDYTDLTALSMLPLAKVVFDHQLKFALKIKRFRGLLTNSLLFATFLSITATTCFSPEQLRRHNAHMSAKRIAENYGLYDDMRETYSTTRTFTDNKLFLMCRFGEINREKYFCKLTIDAKDRNEDVLSRMDRIKNSLTAESPDVVIIESLALEK